MQKRIGNDFIVTLNITRKGSPEDFTNASGITVVLQHMTCSFIRLIPNQITVNGSKISFPVTADQQKEPGKYRVLVKYHKTALDGLKTYTVDKCDIFELVLDSCTDATDTDVVADIDVKIEQDGKDGLSAYELDVLVNNYQGTLEEWLSEVHDDSKRNIVTIDELKNIIKNGLFVIDRKYIVKDYGFEGNISEAFAVNSEMFCIQSYDVETMCFQPEVHHFDDFINDNPSCV